MNSAFLNTKNEFGRDADLGFALPGGGGSGSSGSSLQNFGDNAESVSQIVDTAGSVIGTVKSLFGGGGGKKYSDCGSKQQQLAQTFSKYFSSSDIQQLIADHRQNVGDFSGSTAYDLAFHYLGGSNCKVDTSEGKAWDGRVNQLLQQRQQAQKKSSNPLNAALSGGKTGWILPVGIGVAGLSIAIIALKK